MKRQYRVDRKFPDDSPWEVFAHSLSSKRKARQVVSKARPGRKERGIALRVVYITENVVEMHPSLKEL